VVKRHSKFHVGLVAFPKESEGFARWFWKTQMIKQLGCIYMKSYWILERKLNIKLCVFEDSMLVDYGEIK
jgi:hypothetical protein